MDPMEANKIVAAILAGGIAFMAAGFIADGVIRPTELKTPAFLVKTAEVATAAAPKPAPLPPIEPLLASADIKTGEQYVSTTCAACHNYQQGGGAKVGPDLYDVVGRDRFSVKGFNYSDAVKKLSHGPWTYAELDHWLDDPQKVAPGTRMAFPGIKQTKLRADVIAYLRTLSPKPVPLPTPEQVKTVQGEYEAALKAATVTPTPAKPTTAAASSPLAPPGLPAVTPLLASANVKQGEQMVEQVCAVCHNYKQGGGAKVGPDLYDVVGRERFSVKGFDYSTAVQKLRGGPWTYSELDAWLDDPQKVAPGTRMAFPGIKNVHQRADVIAFLRTLSAKPEPLPAAAKPAATPANAPAAAVPSVAPAVPAKPAAAPSPFAPPGLPAVTPLLASANAKQGEQVVEQVCAVCHNYKQGGGAKVGPDLYGVVGRERFSVKGFDYSDAAKKLRGAPWTYADLNAWLDDPQKVAPGTRMSFPGLKNVHQRADVIAFLRTLSTKPEPLPAATPAKP